MNLIVVKAWGDVSSAHEEYPDDLILWRALNKKLVIAAPKEIGKEMLDKFKTKGIFSSSMQRWLVSTGQPGQSTVIQMLKEHNFLDDDFKLIDLQKAKQPNVKKKRG